MARYNFILLNSEKYPDCPYHPEDTKYVDWLHLLEVDPDCEVETFIDGYDAWEYKAYKPKDYAKLIAKFREDYEWAKERYPDKPEWYEWYLKWIELAEWAKDKDVYWGIGDGC